MQRFIPLLFLGLLVLGCDSADDEDPLDGPATVTGVIVDSQRGEAIEGALVTFALGTGSREARTDSTGTFTIENLATGTFTVTVRADGYLDAVLSDIVVADGVNRIPPAVATEAPPAGAYRIVLSWGDVPSDLDAHLTGPDGNGGRFHVYYSDETFGGVADLDLDDVTSFGPETVTLVPETDGLYRYSVHNYSTQSATGSQGIAGDLDHSIPARVQVYSEAGLVREYRAPAATPGDTWRVFEMAVSGGAVSISDIDTYVDADDSSDTGAFRPDRK